jgi:hypothetical protein
MLSGSYQPEAGAGSPGLHSVVCKFAPRYWGDNAGEQHRIATKTLLGPITLAEG